MNEISEIDESRAPLLDHLIELRRRLLYCIAALAVAFGIAMYFAEDIFAFLVQPLLHAGQKTVIYTQIFEAFFVQVKVAFFAAMMLSFPVIANQLWQFVAPGLYRKEKRALLPFILATPVLFGAGRIDGVFRRDPDGAAFPARLIRESSAGSIARRCPRSATTCRSSCNSCSASGSRSCCRCC